MKQARKMAALAALGLLASGASFAQSGYATPWRGDFWGYIGASAGQSKFRTDCNRTITQFECDTKDTAWKVYAGGRLNQWLGLEIGYTDFGRIKASGGEVDAWAVPLSLVAGVPFGDRFSAFAKVGGLYGRTDVRPSLSALVESGDKSGWGWTYGAGAAFAITPTIQLRADWDRHKLDFVGGRDDVDMLSAGLQFRF
jgi:opacity protein-like surface antigen